LIVHHYGATGSRTLSKQDPYQDKILVTAKSIATPEDAILGIS